MACCMLADAIADNFDRENQRQSVHERPHRESCTKSVKKKFAGSETVDVNPINELTTKLNAFLDIVKKLRSDIQSVKPSRGGKKSDKG